MHAFCRYQIKVLELLACSKPESYSKNWSGQKSQAMDGEFLEIHAPNGPDLSQNIEYASQAALWGIEVNSWSNSFLHKNDNIFICVYIY